MCSEIIHDKIGQDNFTLTLIYTHRHTHTHTYTHTHTLSFTHNHLPNRISGALYHLVITSIVSGRCCGVKARARPKSAIFKPPSLVTKMFWGFRSLYVQILVSTCVSVSVIVSVTYVKVYVSTCVSVRVCMCVYECT